ncbi:MAG: hypothetical protein K2J60_14835 [Acetatifactor sp.]|nr:hypothetical protein [Acetatifactor sp.]
MIYIDLENRKITEETVPSAPVSAYYQSYPTSDHTVFYTVGTEEKLDGEMQLLEGVPANHNTHFFWNPEFSMLSISIDTSSGISRLAFFIPGTDTGWYFDRIPSDSVHEESGTWYSEYGYIIRAVSPERDMYYLYLYEYTP